MPSTGLLIDGNVTHFVAIHTYQRIPVMSEVEISGRYRSLLSGGGLRWSSKTGSITQGKYYYNSKIETERRPHLLVLISSTSSVFLSEEIALS